MHLHSERMVNQVSGTITELPLREVCDFMGSNSRTSRVFPLSTALPFPLVSAPENAEQVRSHPQAPSTGLALLGIQHL